jgi:hypothetical protein
MTVRSALRDKELFAFSPDEALMEVNLESGKKGPSVELEPFQKILSETRFYSVRFVSNQIPDIEFSRLAGDAEFGFSAF